MVRAEAGVLIHADIKRTMGIHYCINFCSIKAQFALTEVMRKSHQNSTPEY
jgi:hypothetical protein